MKAPATEGGITSLTAADETPEVIVPRGRAHLTYARAGNLLLPLRFAVKMPEWRRPTRQRQASWMASNRRRVQVPRWRKRPSIS